MGKERLTWNEEVISDPIKDLGERIKMYGVDAISDEEKQMIINIDEAAFLASILAKRLIAPQYLRKLKNLGRLPYAKKSGNTYLYSVHAITNVRFNNIAHSKE